MGFGPKVRQLTLRSLNFDHGGRGSSQITARANARARPRDRRDQSIFRKMPAPAEALGRLRHSPAKSIRAVTPVFAGYAVNALMLFASYGWNPFSVRKWDKAKVPERLLFPVCAKRL
jgi:hypothetical protein